MPKVCRVGDNANCPSDSQKTIKALFFLMAMCMAFNVSSSKSIAADTIDKRNYSVEVGAMHKISMNFLDFIDSLIDNMPLSKEILVSRYGLQGEETFFKAGVIYYDVDNIAFADNAIVERLDLRNLDNERAYGFFISLEMKDSFFTKQDIEEKFGNDFRLIGIPRPDHLEKTYGYAKQCDGYEIRVGYCAESGLLTSFSIRSIVER